MLVYYDIVLDAYCHHYRDGNLSWHGLGPLRSFIENHTVLIPGPWLDCSHAWGCDTWSLGMLYNLDKRYSNEWGENKLPLLINNWVVIQSFKKFTDHLRGIKRISLKVIKKTERCQHVTNWTWKH